jgi:hypothetical protein
VGAHTHTHTHTHTNCGRTALAPPVFRSCCRLRQSLLRVLLREHTSAYVSIRQHTSAYVSIRQHTCDARIRWLNALTSGSYGSACSGLGGCALRSVCVCAGLVRSSCSHERRERERERRVSIRQHTGEFAREWRASIQASSREREASSRESEARVSIQASSREREASSRRALPQREASSCHPRPRPPCAPHAHAQRDPPPLGANYYSRQSTSE